MSVRTRITLLSTVLVAAALPSAGRAQSVPSPYRFVDTRQEVGLFAGTSTIGAGRFGYGPSGGVHAGARWSADLSGPLGIEAVAGVLSGTRDVVNPAKVVGDMSIGEADARVGMLDARLRFTLTGDRTWRRLAPYLVMGGGMAFDLGGADPLDDELNVDDRFDFGTSFFGTAGGGVRFSLTQRFALRADAVFSLWKIDTPPGFSLPERGFTAVEKGEWVDGRHLSLSLVYRY